VAVEFATIDFETTGLSPRRDRIIEIGIVRTNENGNLVSKFSSLINPGRDVGRTDIHGISSWMLFDAPTFSEISGEVAHFLNGAVLVAHNARFDAQFLEAELEREGRGRSDIDALCTLELMFAAYPNGPRRLGDCCRALNLKIREAHSAIDDAEMASDLLHHLLKRTRVHVFPEEIMIDITPRATRSSIQRSDASDPRKTEASYLAGLVSRLDGKTDVGLTSAASVAQYLNLLDQVLEDRKIESSEAEILVDFAQAEGLSTDRVSGLHAAFVSNLCAIAISDGEVTDFERKDIEQVANLLGIHDWESLLVPSRRSTIALETNVGAELEPGMSVCFTGQMNLSRDELTSRSTEAGLIVKTAVSKKLDLLVVADSDSPSGKAKKARDLRIRIISEAVFLRMLKNSEV